MAGEVTPPSKFVGLGARRVDLPFKPINISGYMEGTHAMMRQGSLSFYKGNGIR